MHKHQKHLHIPEILGWFNALSIMLWFLQLPPNCIAQTEYTFMKSQITENFLKIIIILRHDVTYKPGKDSRE